MNLDRILDVGNGKIIYRDGEECIKVFDKDYTAPRVLTEAAKQARAEELGLRVPRVRGVQVFDGKWGIVSEYIRGKTLEIRMNEEPERSEEYLSLFVMLQKEMHDHPSPFVEKQSDRIRTAIAALQIEAGFQQELLARVEEITDERALCLLDLTPANVILTWGGLPYIVAWEKAARGDILTDAAACCVYFLLSGKPQEQERYLRLFCERNGRTVDEVRARIPVVAAAMSYGAPIRKSTLLISFAQSFL